MNSNLGLSRLLGSKDFYPNTTLSTKRHYAAHIGKQNLRQFAALFLSPAKQQESLTLDELVAQWFTFNGEHTYLNSVSYNFIIGELRRIKRFHQNEQLHLISTEALLKLYIWLQENADIPETMQEDAGLTIDLFHLNLLFNDDVLVGYEKAAESAKRIMDDNYLQRVTLAMSFSQADLININYPQVFYTQFYKTVRLFDFLESSSKYQPLFSQLLSEFQVTKPEFFMRLGSVILHGSLRIDSWNVIVIPNDNMYQEHCGFLDKIAITPDYEAQDQQDDYLPLRARPIERLEPGKYLILFQLFLIKKLYNGVLFLLSAIQRAHPELLKGSFFGSIRADFSEEILLYEVLNQYYAQQPVVRFTGKRMKEAGLIREPDYYLRLNNTVLLHESKDFFMPGTAKLSYDIDEIEKLLKTDGSNTVPPKRDRLGKAVIQIAENIERVIAETIPGDTGYDPLQVEIFPVIVVYDSLYSAVGLNFWVHFWMEEELTKIRAKPEFSSYNFDNIHPVTLVEIDTLIYYQKYFNDGTLDYIELVRNFHAVVNYRKKNVQDVEQFAFQSCIPFSVFVEDYCIEHNINPDPDQLYTLLKSYGIEEVNSSAQ